MNDLSPNDIWCDAFDSKINMRGYIPNKLEEFKPLIEKVDMPCG